MTDKQAIGPHPGRGRASAIALFLAQIALIGCHKSVGEYAEVQPPVQAGGPAQAGNPAHVDNPAHVVSPTQRPRSIRLVANGGIGFDDLVYSSGLHGILAPAGATGCVDLLDSSSLSKTSRCGLSTSGAYSGGHGDGVTSADIGAERLFAVDRASKRLLVLELTTEAGHESYPLSGEPDYVRWVESKREIWVTEPDQEQIEVFTLSDSGGITRARAIAVKGGPESLVIDRTRGRAYSHTWSGRTVAIDVARHSIVEQFANGCEGSRGIAVDPERGFLFAGCAEGKVVVLDVAHSGRILGAETTADGVDIIAANLELEHLYVPAASDGSVTVFGVRGNGALTRLGSLSAARGAHCVASDDHSRIWVCSPDAGALLVFDDPFPRALE